MSNKPTHHLNIVTGEGDNAEFTRIAAVWPTKSGNGFTGTIPQGVSITGRFVITAAKTATGDDNGGQQ